MGRGYSSFTKFNSAQSVVLMYPAVSVRIELAYEIRNDLSAPKDQPARSANASPE